MEVGNPTNPTSNNPEMEVGNPTPEMEIGNPTNPTPKMEVGNPTNPTLKCFFWNCWISNNPTFKNGFFGLSDFQQSNQLWFFHKDEGSITESNISFLSIGQPVGVTS